MKKSLIWIFCALIFFGTAFIFAKRYDFKQFKQGEDFVFVVSKKPDAETIRQREENELQRRAPIDIPDASIVPIQQVKDNKKPTLAFFYVDWCGYCKRFMPIYGAVAKLYNNKFNFAVIHCEKPENQQLVRDFEIHGFPTLFIIDNKINYKFPLSGTVTQDKESLEKELNKYLSVRKHFAK